VEDGAGRERIAIIAEAPGEDEAAAGKPLVGTSGRIMNRIITRAMHPTKGRRLERDDFWLTNVLRCRPPGNVLTGAPYEERAIAQCAPYLEAWLHAKKPRAIVAVGNQALQWFTSQWGIEKLRGYIWETKWGPVVGTYHPAFIARGKFSLAKVVQLDIVRAIEVAEKGIPRVEKDYILRPSPMEVEAYIREYESLGCPPLAFDIETPHSSVLKDEEVDPDVEELSIEDDASYTILRISFAFQNGKVRAITMPWSPPYDTLARRLLATPSTKYGWNCLNFDIPRLEANNAPVHGTVVDGMDAFHFLEPGLPMGLKYAAPIFCPDMPPWKLKARDEPEWYSAADSDVTLRCVTRIKERLEQQGRWEIFNRHFIQLAQVLRKMSQRGILVDRVQREKDKALFEHEKELIVEKLQAVVPNALKPHRIFKKDEEWLRESGNWEEGKMVRVINMEKPKHMHAWVCGPKGSGVLSCNAPVDGNACVKTKKRPKGWECNCGECPPPPPKRTRKKKVTVGDTT